MSEPRRCFVILHDQFHPERGYVPSLVVEDEPGHSPMTGRGELAQPWYWGTDINQAKAICNQVNEEMFKLSPREASDIVMSSMAAGNRQEAQAAAYRVDLASKLGRAPDPADRMLAHQENGESSHA